MTRRYVMLRPAVPGTSANIFAEVCRIMQLDPQQHFKYVRQNEYGEDIWQVLVSSRIFRAMRPEMLEELTRLYCIGRLRGAMV